MEPRAGKASNYSLGGLYVGAFCLAWSCAATAQGLSDNISSLSGSGSVFTGITHTRTDRGGSTDTNTEPGAGVSGQVGGSLESGANSLTLQYGGTLQTKRETIDGEGSGNTSITGASRYKYFDPNSRVDFNLGHTINAVRNNTGFDVDPTSYDARNSLSAGAGMRFNPGELTTLRFFGQAGRSFGENDLSDEESYTVGSELSRRLSERSTGGLNVNRSWSDKRESDNTIDTAQLVYSLRMENGYFSIGAGISQAETDYNDGTTTDNEAGTGFLERTWAAPNRRTSFKYERSLSDSATDLSRNVPPAFSFLPETVRLRGLVVEDSLRITHNNQQVCDACDLGVYAQGAKLEPQDSDTTTYEYRAGVNLGLQLTSLQRLNFGYSWEGDADEDSNVIVDQVHRFNTSWTRRIAENTTFGVEFNQSYVRTKTERNDQSQFEVRLVLSRGFSLTGARR
ncbi:MAG: hypothetical protein ACTHWH_11720 [Marinobacter sp.]